MYIFKYIIPTVIVILWRKSPKSYLGLLQMLLPSLFISFSIRNSWKHVKRFPIVSAALGVRQNHCIARSNLGLGFEPPQDRNFYLIPGNNGIEAQSLVTVPNITGFNPKSLHITYLMRIDLLLIAIRLSNGYVASGGVFR